MVFHMLIINVMSFHLIIIYFLVPLSHGKVLGFVFLLCFIVSSDVVLLVLHIGFTYNTDRSVIYICKQIFCLPFVQKDPVFWNECLFFFLEFYYCYHFLWVFLVVDEQQIGALPPPTVMECGYLHKTPAKSSGICSISNTCALDNDTGRCVDASWSGLHVYTWLFYSTVVCTIKCLNIFPHIHLLVLKPV